MNRKRMYILQPGLALAVLLIFVCSGPARAAAPEAEAAQKLEALGQRYQVFAFNDLGMHCLDADFSIFCILPPFNVVHAQVIMKGRQPVLLSSSAASVYYNAISDLNGSINTVSAPKTNFWSYCKALFGVQPASDVGILGAAMPGKTNALRPFSTYDATHQWFAATGIPITNADDKRKNNPYPLLRVQARLRGQTTPVSTLDVVVPASTEMNCAACHKTGAVGASASLAAKYKLAFSANTNSKLQFRENILLLHDAMYKTKLNTSRPVLCAGCHYSRALDLTGAGPNAIQRPHLPLSLAIHSHHGKTLDHKIPSAGNPAILPEKGAASCYQCHPGTLTNCLRGAMAAKGIQCQQCHGGLLALGGVYKLTTGATRRPWVDLPNCHSCHFGDVIDHRGSSALVSTIAYQPTDPAATPNIARNRRFSENNGQLYRFSHGHNNIACEACHGSPHAEWPARLATANDNITPTEIQGHTGLISECGACHDSALPATLDGPHGMHNVGGTAWAEGHGDFYQANPNACKACHGLNLEGTILSRASFDRLYERAEGGRIQVARGTMVRCALCHPSGVPQDN